MFPVLQHSVTVQLAFVPIASMSAARLPFGRRRFARNHPSYNLQTVSNDKTVPDHVLYLFVTSALDGGERPPSLAGQNPGIRII